MAARRFGFRLCDSVAEALQGIHSNSTVTVGGFGFSSIPENIIEYVSRHPEITGLKVIPNDAGTDSWGLGRLYGKGQIKKQWASYIGAAKVMEQAYLTGETELELIPQGTLAEKIRCCGAGIPAFYMATGLNTLYAEGQLPTRYNRDGSVASYNNKRKVHTFRGRSFLLAESFDMADFAWIKASKADRMGNCTFKGTSYNFNGIMARAAHTVIVEAEEIQIHLPGLYVDRLFQGAKYEHKIEVLRFADNGSPKADTTPSESARELIAQVVAQEFRPWMKCNLGVGIPTMAAGFAAKMGIQVFLQSENGITGCGPYPERGQQDLDWINAGKETITPILGASTFGSDESFAQIRGGHLDMTALGALEVSQYGDLANYMVPNKMVKGMGGAMDLVSKPAKTRVIVVQTHVDKYGKPKIKEECHLPLTGAKCVQMIVTDLAVFAVDPRTGLTLLKYNPSISIEDIRQKTGASFAVAGTCAPWSIPAIRNVPEHLSSL